MTCSGPVRDGPARERYGSRRKLTSCAVNSLASIPDAETSGKRTLTGHLTIGNAERFEAASYCEENSDAQFMDRKVGYFGYQMGALARK